MPLEKAFAIRAAPEVIFAAIERDIASASAHEGETFAVLHRDPPRTIELRVTIAGMPCNLSYRLAPRDDGSTEVAAMVEPYGWRYTAFRIMTLGLRDQGFEVALVESLSNLKAEVESGAPLDDATTEHDETTPDST